MRNIWLIVKREYVSRVMTKKFILTTLLTPLAFGILFSVVGLIFSYRSDSEVVVAVIDEQGILDRTEENWRNIKLEFKDSDIDDLRSSIDEKSYAGILHLPAGNNADEEDFKVVYYADRDLDLQDKEQIRDALRYRVRQHRMKTLGIDESLLGKLDVSVILDPEPLRKKEGAEDAGTRDESPYRAEIAAIIGLVIGFIIYFMVFFSGARIMRSVMEEKINRIVEIMISTVRPFDLMLGKLIGVGGVGMTQILVWLILIPILINVLSVVFGIDPQVASQSMSPDVTNQVADNPISAVMNDLFSINWWLVFPLIIFYYIGGYFIYASLFAAVGSAIGDDLGESQSLTVPITIPIIIALYVAMVSVYTPNSPLAVFASIFPLFSPIVMPARLAFEPPMWQILLFRSIFNSGRAIVYLDICKDISGWNSPLRKEIFPQGIDEMDP